MRLKVKKLSDKAKIYRKFLQEKLNYLPKEEKFPFLLSKGKNWDLMKKEIKLLPKKYFKDIDITPFGFTKANDPYDSYTYKYKGKIPSTTLGVPTYPSVLSHELRHAAQLGKKISIKGKEYYRKRLPKEVYSNRLERIAELRKKEEIPRPLLKREIDAGFFGDLMLVKLRRKYPGTFPSTEELGKAMEKYKEEHERKHILDKTKCRKGGT